MTALEIIANRRDGRIQQPEELRTLAMGAAKGEIPDYQLAAWLMAAFLHPLTLDETAWLTQAMADSGERMNLEGLPKPWVDKHSTGGVGDKTTLVLLPLLASCGLTCLKMSGRGLGITGGTIDKLASVPGFRTDLTPDELKEQAARIGIALTGQTPNLAPADKVLYALRDATATVASVPLIVSSILSKKLAGGAETVVLDVKCGSGAFMKDLAAARELADWLMGVGKRCGLNLRLAITDMDQPLGRCVGNALEVREAIEVLQGASSRFSQLCVSLAGLTLSACGLASDQAAGRELASARLADGSALAKAKEWFAAQGAEGDVFSQPERLPSAPVVSEVTWSGTSGWVHRFDAAAVGQAVVDMGGGRHRKDDVLDYAVGVEILVAVGDRLEPGKAVARVHARTAEQAGSTAERVRAAIALSAEPVAGNPLIHGTR